MEAKDVQYGQQGHQVRIIIERWTGPYSSNLLRFSNSIAIGTMVATFTTYVGRDSRSRAISLMTLLLTVFHTADPRLEAAIDRYLVVHMTIPLSKAKPLV